jgi:hypothetical protein
LQHPRRQWDSPILLPLRNPEFEDGFVALQVLSSHGRHRAACRTPTLGSTPWRKERQAEVQEGANVGCEVEEQLSHVKSGFFRCISCSQGSRLTRRSCNYEEHSVRVSKP